MALSIHQVQGSCAPSKPLSFKKVVKSKNFLAAFPAAKRTDITLLKHKSCLCVTAPPTYDLKRKPLRISCFKGNVQNDESGSRANRSNPLKKPVDFSYVSRGREETLSESANLQNVHAPSTSDANETTTGSLAIQNLFKSWLALLRTPSPNPVVNETLEEPSSNSTVETEQNIQNTGRREILRTLWCTFWGVDATIKIPAMIFIPMYLAVSMKYGTEVAKELTPLWICGPLLVALYIKILQAICSLYVFSFKQSVKTVKALPNYYRVSYDYVATGKLKEVIRVRFWQPVEEVRKLGITGVLKTIWKSFTSWLYDKYLDYVESIWPHYCKLIRALKAANFI